MSPRLAPSYRRSANRRSADSRIASRVRSASRTFSCGGTRLRFVTFSGRSQIPVFGSGIAERSASYYVTSMRTGAPTLFFDLGSPYAYLACERAEALLGLQPEYEPVLLGAIFKWRGWPSWSLTEERSTRMSEVQERARRYGLPPVVWPSVWPANGLAAMRAATWAKQQDGVERFAIEVYRRQFTVGADIADPATLADSAAAVGLDPRSMIEAIATHDVKQELRTATQRAWETGVRGVPSLRAAGLIFYGDDQLEAAAERLRG